MTDMTPELLRRLLRYEPETGKLFWRERTPDMFTDGKHSAARVCTRWNTKHAGAEAFTSDSGAGYKTGDIFVKSFRAHRVIWAMEDGEWPPEDIDHINGDPDDNRMINLRAVSHAENQKNCKMQDNNMSGVTGVYWHKARRRWNASINSDGKVIHLGRFNCITAAAVARKQAEIKYGYHKNHGVSPCTMQ